MTWDDVVRCAHGALRARDYDDEAFRWEIECLDCGELRLLSHAEWASFLVSSGPSPELIEITDPGIESGRYSLV